MLYLYIVDMKFILCPSEGQEPLSSSWLIIKAQVVASSSWWPLSSTTGSGLIIKAQWPDRLLDCRIDRLSGLDSRRVCFGLVLEFIYCRVGYSFVGIYL